MKKLTVRQILVPIDPLLSIEAIQPAKNLAQRFGASVHLVHAHWFDYPAGFTALPGPVPGWPTTVHQQVEASLAARVKEIARTFELPSENCHLRAGAPAFDEICQFAHELPADLIVTSTHGYGGVKHFFLGSTAERLVQYAPCPVVVSRKGRPTIDKILVPVDFSRCSLDGLKYAIQFADQFAAKLFILNAVYLGKPYTSDGFAMYDLSALEREERKNAEQQMLRFVRQANFGRVRFETAIRVGKPVDHITAFAKEQGVDLIITATHAVFPYAQIIAVDRMGGELRPLLESAQANAEEAMQKLQQSVFLRGVSCETEVCAGPAIDEICAASARDDVDLVVTSTHDVCAGDYNPD